MEIRQHLRVYKSITNPSYIQFVMAHMYANQLKLCCYNNDSRHYIQTQLVGFTLMLYTIVTTDSPPTPPDPSPISTLTLIRSALGSKCNLSRSSSFSALLVFLKQSSLSSILVPQNHQPSWPGLWVPNAASPGSASPFLVTLPSSPTSLPTMSLLRQQPLDPPRAAVTGLKQSDTRTYILDPTTGLRLAFQPASYPGPFYQLSH